MPLRQRTSLVDSSVASTLGWRVPRPEAPGGYSPGGHSRTGLSD